MAETPQITADYGTRFKPGNPGKPVGTQNRLTRTVKETVLAVFNEIQDDPKISLKQFASDYPRDFYAIAAKLIPTEVRASIETENIKLSLIFPEGE